MGPPFLLGEVLQQMGGILRCIQHSTHPPAVVWDGTLDQTLVCG